jgi:nucleoside-diphosphate-sugar epimerase
VSASDAERPGDVPLDASDCRQLFSLTDWRPARSVRDVLADLGEWIADNEDDLRRINECP